MLKVFGNRQIGDISYSEEQSIVVEVVKGIVKIVDYDSLEEKNR